MQKSKTIAIIPCRYNATRLPGKLLIKIKGKSIIQRSYENILKTKIFDEVYIATDSEEIKNHLSPLNPNIIMTTICKNGTERIIKALACIDSINPDDIIVNPQADHPCIEKSTIKTLIDILEKKDNMATAASPIQKDKDISSPHIVKVAFDKFQNALYFSRSKIPFSKNTKPAHYHHIGIYAYRKSFLEKLSKLEDTPLQLSEDLEQLKVLEHGYNIKVALVDEAPLGVDIKEDINKIEKKLCQ